MNVMNLIDTCVPMAPLTGCSRIPCPLPSSLASLVQDTTVLKSDRLTTLQQPRVFQWKEGLCVPHFN